MQRIEITFTEDDFVNLNCFINLRRASTRKLLRGIQIFTAALLLLATGGAGFFFYREDWLATKSLLAMLAPFVFFVYLVANMPREVRKDMRKKIRKMTREMGGELFGKSATIELRDDGIFCQRAGSESLVQYAALGEIIEEPDCVYVAQNKAQYFIFPRDRIPKGMLDAFLAELKARKANGAQGE
jgi:hypothetical protein